MSERTGLTTTRILGGCSLVATAFFVLADGLGSALTPNYSAWSDAISELVERGAARKELVDPLLFAYHGLVIPFAVGIRKAVYVERNRPVGPILLGAAGLAGVVLTSFFPCDPGCEPFVSLRGTLHIFIAIPMGIAIIIAICMIADAMKRSSSWKGYFFYSRTTAIAGLILAALTVAFAESELVGALERMLTLSYLQWYVVVGIAIARGRAVLGS